MLIEKYSLILPASANIDEVTFNLALGNQHEANVQATNVLKDFLSDHGKIEVYKGEQVIKNYGITVQGSGSWVKGTIKGTVKSYDYKALYSVYSLHDTQSTDYWFIKYKNDVSRDKLEKTFEESTTVPLDYSLKFRIQGNDYGINSVFITFKVIRLKMNGMTKDYVVTNPASAGAVTPDGSKYPGGFEPIE